MRSPPDASRARGLQWLLLALAATAATVLTSCGLPPPATPPPFHCEDYDAAAEIFFATCAEDAGTDDDAGDVDATADDAGDVDGGP